MTYTFGDRSERELRGVHPELVRVVRRALEITTIDFAVIDGLRTQEEQNEYVRTGASKTMNSKHLIQHDGYGHAVDLVPCLFGKPRWEWPLHFQLVAAVRQAAIEAGIKLTWGGVFDRRLNDLGDNLASEVDSYTDRFIARHGRKPFLDAPHLEMES